MTSVGNILNLVTQVNEKRPVVQAFFRCVLAFSLLFVGSCDKQDGVYVLALEGRTMGTTYHIKAIANYRTIISESALQIQVDKKLESFNEIMSTYIQDSELSLLNQATIGEWHVLSEELFSVISISEKVSRETDGAFDVTVGPLVNLWGFGPEKTDKVPTDEELLDIQKIVGYRFIELKPDSRELLKNERIYIDLSAVAKGYATDVVAEQLREFGFTDFMVEIGGELYVSGKNPSGNDWIIGVEKPSLGRDGAVQAVSVTNVGVATSGDYRNYREVDGVRVSHTIDPATGKPIVHNLASVTVVTETGGYADAYATALNVMGPERGFAFASKHNLAAYFLIRENASFKAVYTPEFERLMKK